MAWTNLSFAYGSVLTSTKMTQLYDDVVCTIPAGTIIAFAGSAAPENYLACPLAPTYISRSTYPALFAAIGTTWGAGDGSTTFGMPWFAAGCVPVQANSNVGVDSAGEVISHWHPLHQISSYQAIFQGSTLLPLHSFSDEIATGVTGGARNLASGTACLMCVKYT